MSWMSNLYETYETASARAKTDSLKPTPISHTVQTAHIKIVINGNGEFVRANVEDKPQVILLPATEKSAGRGSGEAAHALADKLQYVAADYAEFGGLKKPYFGSYQQQLKAWVESPYSHPSLRAINTYVNKGRTVEDLINEKCLWVGRDKKLLTKWDDAETEAPPIFKAIKGDFDQGNALVCWTVNSKNIDCPDTWADPELQRCWIDFENARAGRVGFCYITGEQLRITTSHPAKLRHSGDKAKLISANDTSGFTYRGRFNDTKKSIEQLGLQAAQVGSVTTQKAHNALRWLIRPQGSAFRNNEQVVVAWAVSGNRVPQPLTGSDTYIEDDDDPFGIDSDINDTAADMGQSYSIQLKKGLRGYGGEIAPNERIAIIALDSATPGRMAITYYSESLIEDYIERLNKWHSAFSWWLLLTKEVTDNKGNKYNKNHWRYASPSPGRIMMAVYDDLLKGNEALKKNFYQRLLPCIAEGQPIPRDFVQRSLANAIKAKFGERNKGDYFQWEKNLAVACALYRGHQLTEKRRPKEELPMGLDPSNISRDYLYGRLLAIAEKIEETALRLSDSNRPTNSQRLMQRFATRPFSTWSQIFDQLTPYIAQLIVKRRGFMELRNQDIDEVMNQFSNADFKNDSPLSGEFLLGFHCQRMALRKKAKSEDNQDGDNT